MAFKYYVTAGGSYPAAIATVTVHSKRAALRHASIYRSSPDCIWVYLVTVRPSGSHVTHHWRRGVRGWRWVP